MDDLPSNGVTYLRALLDAVPGVIFVVDQDVTIVDFNAQATALIAPNQQFVLKNRAGNVLSCLNSGQAREGCGHGPSCQDCLIRNSVGRAIKEQEIVRAKVALRLVSDGIERDFLGRISASPFRFNGQDMVLLFIEDLGDSDS